MRDHGGNLDAAIAAFGGEQRDWVDLSTGINPVPYPIPDLPENAWNALPTKTEIASLITAAKAAFGTDWACLPTAGAQAGIQMVPRFLDGARAKVLTPTYNEHAASLTAAGWQVEQVSELDALAGAELCVVVNPNNPDGRHYLPEELHALAGRCGTLIVDESFCDPHPDWSVLSAPPKENIIVFRSFGKFYGLAGLRLGFTFGPEDLIAKLSEMSGPWPVSGPSIEIGREAYSDKLWQAETTARLKIDADRMDELAKKRGWAVLGGTTLFRLYETPDAADAQEMLARHKIWSRIFPYSDRWIRLGLPGTERDWAQLETALLG